MKVRLQMSNIALFGNTFRRGLYCSNGLNRALSYNGFTFARYGHARGPCGGSVMHLCTILLLTLILTICAGAMMCA